MTFFLVLMGITFIALIFQGIVANPDVNITMFYILGIVLVARYTYGYVWGFLFSLLSVISINYFFTFPYHKLNLTLEGYPITFAAMFIIYIMTSAMTTNMKEQLRFWPHRKKNSWKSRRRR